MNRRRAAVFVFCAGVLLGLRAGAQEVASPDHYKQGVSSYLEEDYEAAVKHLKRAMEADQEKDKARRLLNKVLLDAFRQSYKSNNDLKARRYLDEARALFPGDQDVETAARLFQGIKAVKKAPVQAQGQARDNMGSASQAPVKATAVKLPATGGELSSAKPAGKSDWDIQRPWPYLIVLSAGLVLFAAGFMVMQMRRSLIVEMRRNQAVFMEQIDSLKTELKQKNDERRRLAKALEDARQTGKKVQEKLTTSKPDGVDTFLKQSREKVLPPPSWAPPERAPDQGLEEERKKELERIKAEIATRRHLIDSGKGNGPKKAHAQFQKQKMLETLVKITPEGRTQSQQRIVEQAVSLYETFPKEAVKFMGRLAQDNDPIIRANVVAALAAVGDPAMMGLLLELLQDEHHEVKREALKALKLLKSAGRASQPLPELDREKIERAIRAELSKGEWVL
ncbi:MAG: HEAT repeat domain-containing protein [Elusimicrobia bacterium]|nr:HEAT repeat domain-containing protein [Elusimicrobiota bacterium]